tara:strand:- start:1567 stop:1872 length:306 start_codon:yes stop_codon:yes gene_type:complete
MANNPILCEPGIKYFVKKSLIDSHKFKERHSNIIYNVSMLLVFIITLGLILYYRYKGKLTHGERIIKNRRKKEYIVSKLQQLSAIKKNNNMITNLPSLNTF